MTNAQNFKVSFGRIARTLVYEDAQGTILFTFDASPTKDQATGKSNLHLGCVDKLAHPQTD